MTGFRTLDALREIVNAHLDAALPHDAPAPIVDAMRYGLMGGGKRFRPVLTLAAAEAVAARDGRSLDDAIAAALPGACALEFIHSYSLVHDDLPAMDDDILRRGRPTTHVVHGDGMAVLAGDGLLTHAFALLAAAEPANAAMRASRVLARAAGATGMVGGQAVDLIAAGKVRSASAEPLGPEALSDMHFRKTAALLGAAGAVGAILAGADDAAVAAVQTYGHEIGLAFQIVDDILDVEGSSAELGKTAGKDAAANKPTFVTYYGVDDARRMADDCVSSAIATITAVGLGGRLPEIAAWTVSRRN